jgi:hypothetical protein
MTILLDPAEVVVRAAHSRPFSLQSDFARKEALGVAIAASRGWITCLDPVTQESHNRWLVTHSGLFLLETLFGENKDGN